MLDQEPKDRVVHAGKLAAKQDISLPESEVHQMFETEVDSLSNQQQTDANNSNTVKQLMSYKSVATGSDRIYQLQSYASESNTVKQLLSFQSQADSSPKSKTLIAHQNFSSRPTQLQTLQLARDDYNNNENRTEAQETAHKHTYGQAESSGGKLYIGRMYADNDQEGSIQGDGTMGTLAKKKLEIANLEEQLNSTDDDVKKQEIQLLIAEKTKRVESTLSQEAWTPGVNDAFVGGGIDIGKSETDESGSLMGDARFKIKTELPQPIKELFINFTGNFNQLMMKLVELDTGKIITNKETGIEGQNLTFNGESIKLSDEDSFSWKKVSDNSDVYPFTVTFREFRQLLKANFVFRETTAANPSKAEKNFGVFPSDAAYEKFEIAKVEERQRRTISGQEKKQNLTREVTRDEKLKPPPKS